jgi:hypothetical protein
VASSSPPRHHTTAPSLHNSDWLEIEIGHKNRKSAATDAALFAVDIS